MIPLRVARRPSVLCHFPDETESILSVSLRTLSRRRRRRRRRMGFEELEPIFGEPRVEWGKIDGSGGSGCSSAPLRRFMMHVFASDYYHLKVHVTDYHSRSFEAVKSVEQLEDMRDSVGIGGSWSEFLDYFVASIKSGDVKLVLENKRHPDHPHGAESARLVSQKSKGMPLISIPLLKLVGSAASDAMENMSFGLLKALKCSQNSVSQVQEHSSKLVKNISTDKETSENMQSQLEKKQKLEKMNASEKTDVSIPGASNELLDSPGKKAAQNPAAKKVTNRVVPAFRRAKVRGAFLQDAEDDKDS